VELRHLRYFVAVAEAGSIVNAARALNVAQPALSRQIQALERLVGVTLLERLPHGVRLTRAGRAFLADSRRPLLSARRAVSRARDGATVDSAQLRIVFSELLAYWRVIADVLHQYRVQYPMVELVTAQTPGSQMVAALREERCDLAIVGVSKWPVRGLDGVRLIDVTQTGVLLPADHPVAAAEKVRLADLSPLTWYHLPSDATLGVFEHSRVAMRKRGLKVRHKTARAGGFAGLPQIAAGNGFAFANSVLANAVTAVSTSIVYRPFAEEPFPVWLALLWKKRHRIRPIVDFVEIAQRICKPMRPRNI
jgi:DNA-binding transcriptional LysR family regulator